MLLSDWGYDWRLGGDTLRTFLSWDANEFLGCLIKRSARAYKYLASVPASQELLFSSPSADHPIANW